MRTNAQLMLEVEIGMKKRYAYSFGDVESPRLRAKAQGCSQSSLSPSKRYPIANCRGYQLHVVEKTQEARREQDRKIAYRVHVQSGWTVQYLANMGYHLENRPPIDLQLPPKWQMSSEPNRHGDRGMQRRMRMTSMTVISFPLPLRQLYVIFNSCSTRIYVFFFMIIIYYSLLM